MAAQPLFLQYIAMPEAGMECRRNLAAPRRRAVVFCHFPASGPVSRPCRTLLALMRSLTMPNGLFPRDLA